MTRSATAATPLIGATDPAPFARFNSSGQAPALVVCDHASNAVPAALHNLGLPAAALERHIAWDIGAADLARSLALYLDAPAVLAGFSRLVVDCNRHLDDPSSMLIESDGQAVPGNMALDDAAREQRIHSFHEPYHQAIESELASFSGDGIVPAFISIHSFTPVLNGERRPWHVGVLWDHDARMAAPMLAALRARPELCVGDNFPYSGRHPTDYTVHRHADRAGLPYLCLEVRQDLLADAAGVARWTEIIGPSVHGLLDQAQLHKRMRRQ